MTLTPSVLGAAMRLLRLRKTKVQFTQVLNNLDKTIRHAKDTLRLAQEQRTQWFHQQVLYINVTSSAGSLKATHSLKHDSSCSKVILSTQAGVSRHNVTQIPACWEHQLPRNKSTNLCIQTKDKRGLWSGLESAYQLQPKYLWAKRL